MNVNELRELIILEHGQYIPDDIEISLADLNKILARHVLTVIGKYRPMRRVKNIYFQTGTEPYIFTSDIPDWVSDVAIVMTSQTNTITGVIPQMFRQENRSRLWLYDKPRLYSFMFGQISVQACYYPKLVQESGDLYVINDLDDKAQQFLVDLTAGYLLLSIGRARRTVNFGEFPVVTDANELVAEGQRLIDITMQELKNQNAFWLAV
jgi:hypothetical protein